MATSYEVYAHKGGNWNIDSVYDDKAEAMYEAKQLLDSRYSTGVKVIEERFDDETGDTASKIIFQQVKGSAAPKKKAAAKPKARVATAKKDNKPKKSEKSFTKYVLLLVLAVGGIGAGLLGLLFFLVHLFE